MGRELRKQLHRTLHILEIILHVLPVLQLISILSTESFYSFNLSLALEFKTKNYFGLVPTYRMYYVLQFQSIV